MVLNRPRPCSTQMVGTTAGGMISPASTKKLTMLVQRDGRRCSTKPTMAPKIDQQRDAGDGEDDRVDEGGDQHVVAGLDAPRRDCPRGASSSASENSRSADFARVLDRREDDEGEGHEEHDDRDERSRRRRPSSAAPGSLLDLAGG